MKNKVKLGAKALPASDPLLRCVALTHLLLVPLLLFAAWLDPRQVLGLDPWNKPLKFALSIAVYLATLSLLVRLLGRGPLVTVVRWTAALAMPAETLLISLQSLRGTTSHYNHATAFDSRVYELMKWVIIANTWAVILLLVLFSTRRLRPALGAGLLWGIRCGLAIFVVGSMEGIVMAVRGGHSVGTADGGPGLAFLDWSTVGGDLRVAHFLGIHALQALPLVGLAIDAVGRRRAWSAVHRRALSLLAAGLYAAAVGALFLSALDGTSLLRLAGFAP